jgi:hypothetical protein
MPGEGGVVEAICRKNSVIPVGMNVWFEVTEGSEVRTCPMCLEREVVDACCRRCSDIPVGTCPSCYEEGLEGEVCGDCGVEFWEEVMMGECQNCQEEGIQGTICDNCEDQGFIFE